MITGLRAATFKNLQLNAGVFLKDFDYSSAANATALKTAIKSAITAGTGLIGATIGGGTFTCTPNMRAIEVDGKRFEFVGSQVNDGWNIYLSGTMKEVTADNMKTALMSADVATSGNKTTITLRNEIKDTDYIENLVWIGDTSEGAMLIDLQNALNTSGAAMTFTDKGEGSIPFEFHAHSSTVDADTAPVTVVFLTDSAS